MSSVEEQCLVLACGNTLRGDDGVGIWLALWADQKFNADPGVRVVIRQQWTPDLAADIAECRSVLFLDCSVDSAPGEIQIKPVQAAPPGAGLSTHHAGAPELLLLARQLYNAVPANAFLLTIGAGSIEMAEEFSSAVQAALPHACHSLERTVLELLGDRARPARFSDHTRRTPAVSAHRQSHPADGPAR